VIVEATCKILHAWFDLTNTAKGWRICHSNTM